MPVLHGPGIKEWLCIANRSLLFEGIVVAPSTSIDIVVRDASGAELRREKIAVGQESAIRVLLSDVLDASVDKKLSIGSLKVSRRSDWPGIRGTLRPQIEIISSRGSCAVHTQAPGHTVDRWLSVYHRPDYERLFISVVNANPKVLIAQLKYPVIEGPIKPVLHQIAVAPYGAALHEIKIAEELGIKIKGQIYGIQLDTDGKGKLHFLCATPTLDRFSIDHL
jgi:hypothetical protein